MTSTDEPTPNYFRVLCAICRGCDHQPPPCVCLPSTYIHSTALAGSCNSSMDRAAATHLQQQPQVWQAAGWQFARDSSLPQQPPARDTEYGLAAPVWHGTGRQEEDWYLEKMQLPYEAGKPSWNISFYLIPSKSFPLTQRSKSSFPTASDFPMTSLFSLFLPKADKAAACQMSLFCRVLQDDEISAIMSCPLKDHSPP